MSYNSEELRTIQRHRAVIETVPSPKSSVICTPAIRLEKDVRETVIDCLDPSVKESVECGSLCKTFIKNLTMSHREVAKARLQRIANQDSATPFEVITDTELAHGFSDATLTDARLVTEMGLGVMYTALDGLLRESGLSPKKVLPSSMTGPVLNRKSLHDGEIDVDELSDITSRSELKSQSKQQVDSLRHQIKYTLDCAFMRAYYDHLVDELEVTNCPKIVWKQASINVQNDVDPFAEHSKDSDDSALNENIRWFSHENQLDRFSTQSKSSKPTEEASQTGLDQF